MPHFVMLKAAKHFCEVPAAQRFLAKLGMVKLLRKVSDHSLEISE